MIRPGSAADLPAIAALEARPDTARWLGRTGLDWHARALSDPATEHLVSIGPDAEPAGFAVLAGLGGPSAGLRRVVIAPEHRGQGRGRALVLAAVARGRHRGARQVWLDVKEDNARARALYESLGFAGDPARGGGGLIVMVYAIPLPRAPGPRAAASGSPLPAGYVNDGE